MSGGMIAKQPSETHPPGVFHLIGLLFGWIVLTAFAELVLFTFWYASTIGVFAAAGPVAALVGIVFAVLMLAGAPLACAYIVRRGDRWLMQDK